MSKLLNGISGKNNMRLAFKEVISHIEKEERGYFKDTQLEAFYKQNNLTIRNQLRESSYYTENLSRSFDMNNEIESKAYFFKELADRMVEQAVFNKVNTRLFKEGINLISLNNHGIEQNQTAEKYINLMKRYVLELNIKSFCKVKFLKFIIQSIDDKVSDTDVLHLIKNILLSGIQNNKMFREDKINDKNPICALMIYWIITNFETKLIMDKLNYVRQDCLLKIFIKTKLQALKIQKEMTLYFTSAFRPVTTDF
jgi:hypothetical protein